METLVAQFASIEGAETGPTLSLPASITAQQLNILINELLHNEEPQPYSFFVGDAEILHSLQRDILQNDPSKTESVMKIVYRAQALFRVQPATRCSTSLTGHSKEILAVTFAPHGQLLATASGDGSVRFWDAVTETPLLSNGEAKMAHKNWVLCIAFAPDGASLVSGSVDGSLCIWEAASGKCIGRPLIGHTQFVCAVAWEPLHLNADCSRVASASKDGSARVWDVARATCLFAMGIQATPMTCLRWAGDGSIVVGARDRTIRVFDAAANGALIRTLEAHAHWVNSLALSTDAVLRAGAFDERGWVLGDAARSVADCSRAEMQRWAATRFAAVCAAGEERLVSGSDDATLILWALARGKRLCDRMTGHQAPVNHVIFSPDSSLIASSSFDKSVRLWNGITGQFIATFRGHVGPVYCSAFSPDGRFLVSASRDSTLRLWNVRTRTLHATLAGHSDEVYAVDWSSGTGEGVIASGGKDRLLKIWRQ